MDAKIHPLVALVRAIGAFLATSVVFNLVYLMAFFLHVDRIFGGLLQAIATFAVILMVWPLSFQAMKSRMSPRLIAFLASVLLCIAYTLAARYKVFLVTHYLYPHIPGTEVHLDTTNGKVGVLLFSALFITIAVWMSKESTSREEVGKGATHERSEAADLVSDGGEGIIEGIIDQVHHLH